MVKTYICDGSCLGNPGPGGWCYAKLDGHLVEFVYGFEENTTNNRMELVAVLKLLEFSRSQKVIYTDSKYVVDGITKWIYSWKKSGWKNSKKEPVKNEDLWKSIDELKSTSEFRWMKGHDIPFLDKKDHFCSANECSKEVQDKNMLIRIQNEVDRLARNAAERKISTSEVFEIKKFQ